MDTLPDYLDNNLAIISVGLNPSPVSVREGFYFANPRNRFWPALNGSRLVDAPLEPGVAAMQTLLDKYRIGFTDIVKRPTRGASHLRAADYREGAAVLKEKLLACQPRIAWFHGKVPYRNYLRYAEGQDLDIPWGAQKHLIGKARVYVTPNPSPANAAYSLEQLIAWYNDMVSILVRESFGF